MSVFHRHEIYSLFLCITYCSAISQPLQTAMSELQINSTMLVSGSVLEFIQKLKLYCQYVKKKFIFKFKLYFTHWIFMISIQPIVCLEMQFHLSQNGIRINQTVVMY